MRKFLIVILILINLSFSFARNTSKERGFSIGASLGNGISFDLSFYHFDLYFGGITWAFGTLNTKTYIYNYYIPLAIDNVYSWGFSQNKFNLGFGWGFQYVVSKYNQGVGARIPFFISYDMLENLELNAKLVPNIDLLFKNYFDNNYRLNILFSLGFKYFLTEDRPN